ncbi:hypothetical protein D3C81_2154750 [compost metagenome]
MNLFTKPEKSILRKYLLLLKWAITIGLKESQTRFGMVRGSLLFFVVLSLVAGLLSWLVPEASGSISAILSELLPSLLESLPAGASVQ